MCDVILYTLTTPIIREHGKQVNSFVCLNAQVLLLTSPTLMDLKVQVTLPQPHQSHVVPNWMQRTSKIYHSETETAIHLDRVQAALLGLLN